MVSAHNQSDDANKVSFPKVKKILILFLLKRMGEFRCETHTNCLNWEYLSVCGYTVAVEQACGELLLQVVL